MSRGRSTLKYFNEVPLFIYQKLVLEKEMNHLGKLGIINKGLTEYSSPVVLMKTPEFVHGMYKF